MYQISLVGEVTGLVRKPFRSVVCTALKDVLPGRPQKHPRKRAWPLAHQVVAGFLEFKIFTVCCEHVPRSSLYAGKHPICITSNCKTSNCIKEHTLTVYLLKPVSFDELFHVMFKIILYHTKRHMTLIQKTFKDNNFAFLTLTLNCTLNFMFKSPA